jgi:hypothetical protein
MEIWVQHILRIYILTYIEGLLYPTDHPLGKAPWNKSKQLKHSSSSSSNESPSGKDNFTSGSSCDSIAPNPNDRYANLQLVFDPSDTVPTRASAKPVLDTSRSPPALDTPESILSFVHQPAPRTKTLECRLVRQRSGVEKLYPSYQLFLESPGKPQVLILTARKRKKTANASYVISLGHSKAKDQIVAKLKSNFIGTEFTMFSDQESLKLDRQSDKLREWGAVVYETNILGLKGPRKMSVLLPAMQASGEPFVFHPINVSFFFGTL